MKANAGNPSTRQQVNRLEKQLKHCLGLLHAMTLALCSANAFALGNHPEADTCPPDKPFYSVCTHSLHSLEGWYGECRANQAQAQQDADQHAESAHGGNSRWTGVLKARNKRY